ncbi:DUF2569 domain-containing protein [Kangiella marina]|uniref:DUF2569 domain-containing protein n=1 Tax=Kangiella marina TaxID=1079178 RepID=A0ABP8IJL9_9GAMM
MDNKLQAFDDDPNYLKGLGGWLIVVAIGIVLNPILLSYQLNQELFPLISDGTLAVLSDPSSDYYIEYFAALFYAELALNIALLLAWLSLLFLFFYKHKAFPRIFILVISLVPFIVLLDSVMVNKILPEVSIFNAETIKLLARSIVYAAIWIPYMLMSERVKKTFTRPDSDNEEQVSTTTSIPNEA